MKKKHECLIGSYMSDPTMGAMYIHLTKKNIEMIPVLMEKHTVKRGRMYRFCPDCNKPIPWQKLGGLSALYVLETY